MSTIKYISEKIHFIESFVSNVYQLFSKPAAEGAAELVHEKLRLARVGRPHDVRVEGDITRTHFNTAQIQAVCSLYVTGSRR